MLTVFKGFAAEVESVNHNNEVRGVPTKLRNSSPKPKVISRTGEQLYLNFNKF